MATNKRYNPRYTVDWWLISVSTIKRSIIGFILFVVGFSIYFALRMYLDHRTEIARAAAGDSDINRKPEKSGYFLDLEGDIKVKKNGTFEWLPANKRMNLNTGDLVKTGDNSSAHILSFDGTEYTVKSQSLMMIQSSSEDSQTKVRNVAIKLSSGAIDMSTAKRNQAGSSTELNSPTTSTRLGEMTQAGVTVNAESAKTSVQIYRGEGEIRSGGASMRLAPLESVTVSDGGAFESKVRILPPPDLIEPSNLKQIASPDLSKELVYIAWRQVEGAKSFRLLVSPTPLFSTPLVDFHMSGKDLSVRVAGLIVGTYFWKAYAVDQNGIEGRPSEVRRFRIIAQDQRVQKFDVVPPALTVDEPRLSGNIALMRGRTEPGALLTINGEQVDVESDGSFFHPAILPHSGQNELVVIAQDASGNENKITKVVYAEFY